MKVDKETSAVIEKLASRVEKAGGKYEFKTRDKSLMDAINVVVRSELASKYRVCVIFERGTRVPKMLKSLNIKQPKKPLAIKRKKYKKPTLPVTHLREKLYGKSDKALCGKSLEDIKKDKEGFSIAILDIVITCPECREIMQKHEFKVGDKVKVVKTNPTLESNHLQHLVGQKGVVKTEYYYGAMVKLNKDKTEGEYFFPNECLKKKK